MHGWCYLKIPRKVISKAINLKVFRKHVSRIINLAESLFEENCALAVLQFYTVFGFFKSLGAMKWLKTYQVPA